MGFGEAVGVIVAATAVLALVWQCVEVPLHLGEADSSFPIRSQTSGS